MRCCTVLGGNRSCCFPQPMCRAVLQPRFVALLAKPIPEPSFRERATVVGNQKRQITDPAGVDYALKFREDRKLEFNRLSASILLLREAQLGALDVLSPEAHHVGASLLSMEEQGIREARLCTDWMLRFELRPLLFCPRVISVFANF